MLEKLQELFPEMAEGVLWYLTVGNVRNVLDFLAKMLDEENLPLTQRVIWNELGRNCRCLRKQSVEVNIDDMLDCSRDEDKVTFLTLLDHSNIIRNMSLHDTRRTNFVLSELLVWTKYLQYVLQLMYEVANEIDEEKEALKGDHAELLETHEVSRVRHEEQLLLQQVVDLKTRAEPIKASTTDSDQSP